MNSLPGTFTMYEVVCVGETDNALRVEFDGEQVWVPKSVVDDDSEVFERGHTGNLVVAEWWADKHGWT